MKEKGILKLKAGEKERTMNYTVHQGKVYLLTLNNSNKIKDITDDAHVQLKFDLKSDETTSAVAKIMTDNEKIKWLFDKMLEEKNTHFKKYNNRLIVLEVELD